MELTLLADETIKQHYETTHSEQLFITDKRIVFSSPSKDGINRPKAIPFRWIANISSTYIHDNQNFPIVSTIIIVILAILYLLLFLFRAYFLFFPLLLLTLLILPSAISLLIASTIKNRNQCLLLIFIQRNDIPNVTVLSTKPAFRPIA
ncbi:MAG: hypothetical protein IJ009_06275 [Clostridia bacterium]|nr:hypothetical protein [Clostridia bacterium]